METHAQGEDQSANRPTQADSVGSGNEHCDELETGASLDNATEYSDAGSLATREGFYSSALARKIWNDLGVGELSEETLEKLTRVLPDLLKNFAPEIAQASKDQVGRDTMFHVHKNRDDITRAFLNLFSEHQDDETECGFKKDVVPWKERWERIVNWNEGQGDAKPRQEAPEDFAIETETETVPQHSFDSYRIVLDEASAYTSLLDTVRREIALTHVQTNYMEMVRRKISEALPRQRISRHRQSPMHEATIELEWNPLAFFEAQKYDLPPHEAAERVIVLTGSHTDAQAMTCGEYMSQTWPSTGAHTLQCFLDMLQDGQSRSQYVPASPGSRISLFLRESQLVCEVIGTRGYLTEIGEQLAWLGAALQPGSSLEGVSCSLPVVERCSVATSNLVSQSASSARGLCYKMTFRVEDLDQQLAPLNGQCWHNLFRNPVLVQGYPIRNRPQNDTGLEISLKVMASLAQAQYLNMFCSRPIIKGFSTILYPSYQSGDLLIWHLVYNEDGGHISFLRGVTCYTLSVSIPEIERSRHILGWCSEAKLYAGAPDALYPVLPSELEPLSELEGTHKSCILRDASVSGGWLLTGDESQIGSRERPLRLERGKFSDKMKWLEKKKVVFWDDGDKRGWLVNGLSALLHLLRAYIQDSSSGNFRRFFLLKPESLVEASESYTAKAAVDVLMNPENWDLPLFSREPGCLKDRIEHFYNILDQLICHQDKIDKSCFRVSENMRPRRYLEGWDFSDFACEQDPVEPRVAELEPIARGWSDLIRSMHAVVLFGRGFGDIIQPSNTSQFCRWAQVPKGEYYLTALVCDLQTLKQINDKLGISITRLGSDVVWHSPGKTFEPCQCGDSASADHSDFVQVLLPRGISAELHVTESLGQASQHRGALIFGHNPSFSWVWKDFGKPERGDPRQLIDDFDHRAISSDSGIGSETTGTQKTQSPSSDPDIGIICALPKELMAVRALFDCSYSYPRVPEDSNSYVFGHLGGYNVVAACLPYGEYGTNSAATVATHLNRSFPWLQFCLLVGIGGGIPSRNNDIRLGDVVVGLSSGPGPGVIQYNAGKVYDGRLEPTKQLLDGPPRGVRKVISNLESNPIPPERPLEAYIRQIVQKQPKYGHPGKEHDVLYVPSPNDKVDYSASSECTFTLQPRPQRPSTHPVIHYGPIASGNQLVKDAALRDRLERELNAYCVEMEAAGIVNELRCLVIRGICDYADCHKNDKWQEYAAATAAAYAKYLLIQIKESGA
ncbi:hypothetical protein EDB81DRAFT_888840 [Dactylonectria macrodidyma]|uniref:Nucleoside phosphorylase domain-containing protein n=1 Tax=Dactylonectria macrodidyma TaxID=307937 RepID=A0A9P9E111_9HYPO|nr:hypothetical protein EDB81DRAFT_888840 [Dactylonectria macrodidyma]